MRILLLAFLAACGTSSSATVDAAGTDATASADTWTSWAQGFTATYCAATCHAPGGSGVHGGVLDFTMYSNVFTNRAAIRCGVSAVALADCGGSPPPKQFPIAAPYPSDADRGRMVGWVTAGAAQ